MSLNNSPAPSSAVFNAVKGALGLFSDLNKSRGSFEDNNPLPIDEYESSYSEMEIIDLTREWKRTYGNYYKDVEGSQQMAFEYWIGKQSAVDDVDNMGTKPLIDNKIFEAIETFIPIATRSNPDPLVQADPNGDGPAIQDAIKKALVHEADRQKFRKILKGLLRHWIIYRLGILKVSYNKILDEIETEVINPKRMIFDKDGHWGADCAFTGEYIGERKQTTAGKLAELFPKKSELIAKKSFGKKGTKLEYIEWWYHGTDVFYTMDDNVLGKFKNPHWNYDIAEKIDEETGEPISPEQEGTNHFKLPQSPYIGLSIFTTGLSPHDETGLILQNVGIQDMINRRWRQLDKNIDGMNNGMVVNDKFTDAQASQAVQSLRRGTAIRYPGTNVTEGVMRFPAPALPAQVFELMKDGRDELANIFGTSGSTPSGLDEQDTVRGKIMINQMDSSRIGGGVTEFLEQVSDRWYNWLTQMMFVHFTDDHYILTAGQISGTALIQIRNTDFAALRTLDITVKEGSLVPKDPLTQRNEAMDLWSANALDPITLGKKLDMPDPIEYATQLLTWQLVQKGVLPPQAYLPNFMQGAPQALPQAGVGGQAVNPIGPQTPPPAPQAGTQGAAQAESKQLLQSVPLK